jgi:hypothetical protein
MGQAIDLGNCRMLAGQSLPDSIAALSSKDGVVLAAPQSQVE